MQNTMQVCSTLHDALLPVSGGISGQNPLAASARECYTDDAVQQMLLCRWLWHLRRRVGMAVPIRCRVFCILIIST